MPEPVERVVLLGFMASGKTTVGRLLAERLGWEHVDFDREIEREQGRSVAEIFRAGGEARFRALEAEITPRLVAPARRVLSPGGGWITNPDLLDLLPRGTLTAWLAVSPEEVVRRLAAEPDARPLLAGADPAADARRLLRKREPLYRRAGLRVDTDGRGPPEIAGQLYDIVRGRRRRPL